MGGRRLFYKPKDYEAFAEIVEETLLTRPMRICGDCLMPNHWHLVLWPEHDGQLAAFMQRLTITHVTRWQKHRGKVGEGHLYQGRFKSFPVEENDYIYQVNAVRRTERCGPRWWIGRKTGGGAASGGACTVAQNSARFSGRGRSRSHADGPSSSMSPSTKPKCRRCVSAWREASHLAVILG